MRKARGVKTFFKKTLPKVVKFGAKKLLAKALEISPITTFPYSIYKAIKGNLLI